MAKGIPEIHNTSRLDASQMGHQIDTIIQKAKDERRTFERHWYDNNFFDDGHHFRYFSRTQNKIVDLAERSTIYAPMRAIPKASRQIRGVANLLLPQEPTPVIYPEKINPAAFPPREIRDEEGTLVSTEINPEYQEALDNAKRIAMFAGHWVSEEFKEQNILDKLALMIILAAKHGVSYMQIWPDSVHEKIRTQVYDAFDIYLKGDLNSIYDSPFIGKARPRRIEEIKADERFDIDKRSKLTPDNRFSSSSIKEAYMKARFGGASNPEAVATVIEKEFFVKEYLDEHNKDRIARQKNSSDILDGKEKGDVVIRHTFVAGDVTVLDEYTDLPEYPFVDYRLEPGAIYQVPLIERFIPVNKSLDLVVSRLERYIHTMVVGGWKKRQGEQFNITNSPGGQILEYASTPPEQIQVLPLPNFVFSFLDILGSLIEEQGVTTTTLGKLPKGVKAHAAIESLKESEFANLVMASRRTKSILFEVLFEVNLHSLLVYDPCLG